MNIVRGSAKSPVFYLYYYMRYMRDSVPRPASPFFRERDPTPKNLLGIIFCLDLFTMVTTKAISIIPVGPSPTAVFN